MATVCLISCSSSKRRHDAQAQFLYNSAVFKESRKYARRFSDTWYILSAKYGILLPETVISPYDLHLGALPPNRLAAWRRTVRKSVLRLTSEGDCVVVLAGRLYCAELMDALRDAGRQVEAPMQHMKQGARLRWLIRQKQGVGKATFFGL